MSCKTLSAGYMVKTFPVKVFPETLRLKIKCKRFGWEILCLLKYNNSSRKYYDCESTFGILISYATVNSVSRIKTLSHKSSKWWPLKIFLVNLMVLEIVNTKISNSHHFDSL